MPHSRIRYAEPILKQLLTHSPILGVLGQRQTGKTTLTESISGEYASLDQDTTLELAEKNPEKFIKARSHPFTIDECQLAPTLFPALKEWVRTHPKKGQFILTGSVRFTNRKAIRESLTGRIVNLELLPFSIAEGHSEPLPERLTQWIKARTFPQIPLFSNVWLQKYETRFLEFLEVGGLPGICFFRSHAVRAPRFETHLETLLERDIRFLIKTAVTYRHLKQLCLLLALQQGQPVNFSHLGRKVGVSPPTIRNLITAMEGMLLLRVISSEKQSNPVVFFEDQGTASYLIGDQKESHRDLVRGLFANLLPQFLYRPEQAATFSQYKTRGGALVDIVIRTHTGTIGIIPIVEEKATSSSLASARSFLANFVGAKVVIAHQGKEAERVSETILSIPFQLLLSDSWL